MVVIRGGHAPVSLSGSSTVGGMLEVEVVSTRERGMPNNSSSSAMSSTATEEVDQLEVLERCRNSIPAPLPAFSVLKSLSWTLVLKPVPPAAVNHSINLVDARSKLSRPSTGVSSTIACRTRNWNKIKERSVWY